MGVSDVVVALLVIVVIFSYRMLRVVSRLSLVVDESLANRIIEAERIKTAHARLELYESEDNSDTCALRLRVAILSLVNGFSLIATNT